MAARTILVIRGTGAFMRRVLAVRAAAGTIGAMTSLVTFLMAVVTDNSMRGWVRGWWALRVRLHGPMTITIKATIVTS